MRQRLGLPRQKTLPRLRSAFRTAGEKFEALKDLANTAVVVPYGDEGKRLVAALCALPPPDEMNVLLKKAQMFTVNITEGQVGELLKAGAIRDIRTGDQDRSFWIACETGYDCCDLGLGEV